MLKSVTEFVDFDGVTVPVGTNVECIVRRGYSKRRKGFFWNGIKDGRVVFVTFGRPDYFEKYNKEIHNE